MIGEGGLPTDVVPYTEIIQPKKVLRVSPDFGKASDVSDQLSMALGDAGSDHETKIIKVFEKHGYDVVRGGNFNTSNATEIGINTSSDELGLNSLERNRRLSEITEAVMPQEFDLGKIIDSSVPIVAKDLT